MLIICILASIVVTCYANDNADTDHIANVSDEKSINNFLDEISETPFTSDGAMYVIMHHDISDVGKIYDESYFPELEIELIEDKTATGQNTVKEDYDPEFRNVLKIFLTDKSRKNIIESIEQLQKRADKDIYWAQPSYETTYEIYEQYIKQYE